MPKRNPKPSRGDEIRRKINERLAKAFQAKAPQLDLLVEQGLLDADAVAALGTDPLAALKVLKQKAREIRERPSLLSELGVRAIDVLGTAPDRPAGALPAPSPTDLIVVFTDLAGFTAFTQDEGDVSSGRILTGHYGRVDEIVASRGGSVVKRLGDGHLLTFTTPRAAVLASLELIDAAPEPLPLRAGGHVGEVMRLEHDILGHTVNVASRVADAASGGRALVTASLRDRSGPVPGVAFGDPNPIRLRGLEEAVPVCELGRYG